jgi:hypothetical protein
VNGRIRCKGEVVHIVANHLTDLSANLAGVGAAMTVPLWKGRGEWWRPLSQRLIRSAMQLPLLSAFLRDRHSRSFRRAYPR